MFTVNPSASQDLQALYAAQAQAKEVMQTRWFPCYRKDYISSQQGLYKGYLVAYSTIYEVTDFVGTKVQAVVSVVFQVVGAVLRPVYCVAGFLANPVYPVNPVNGKRHFTLIPRRVEKFLGDWIFYPLATWGKSQTCMPLTKQGSTIQDIATKTIENLVDHNQPLLHPENTIPFDYRVLTIASEHINAFACPGGGMVLYSRLAQEIQWKLDKAEKDNSIPLTSTVTLADGSKVIVDLGDINVEDVLSVLMGHEMTHVASRHGIVAIVQRAAFYVFIQICRVGVWAHQSTQRNQKENERTGEVANEAGLRLLDSFLEWLARKGNEPLALLNSRNNEYEADVTGAYMAHQANRNPLAALFLQDLLMGDHKCSNFFRKHFEFLYTHPFGENRKRAILAGIQSFAPDKLERKTTLKLAPHGYDLQRSGPAMKFTCWFQ